MIAHVKHRRYAAIVWDGGIEHAFSGNTIGELLLDVRRAFPTPAVPHEEPLFDLAQTPIDASAVARALGITKSLASQRLLRAKEAGWLVRLRRGLYQAAP